MDALCPTTGTEETGKSSQEGIAVLIKCEEAAILLEQKIMEYGHESEVQILLKELVMMKARISKLLEQARQGLHTIKISLYRPVLVAGAPFLVSEEIFLKEGKLSDACGEYPTRAPFAVAPHCLTIPIFHKSNVKTNLKL
ncbi:hypothetical protein RR46_01885 [Papilio xuthus]|uniref:Uncharacterized protein n=1 Tax=Papilio xuthus TaxID=66420 RepID=A0A194QEG7_PAPXU|nr:hypothetical protein RR46_01885 [Papilio xuthus]